MFDILVDKTSKLNSLENLLVYSLQKDIHPSSKLNEKHFEREISKSLSLKGFGLTKNKYYAEYIQTAISESDITSANPTNPLYQCVQHFFGYINYEQIHGYLDHINSTYGYGEILFRQDFAKDNDGFDPDIQVNDLNDIYLIEVNTPPAKAGGFD